MRIDPQWSAPKNSSELARALVRVRWDNDDKEKRSERARKAALKGWATRRKKKAK